MNNERAPKAGKQPPPETSSIASASTLPESQARESWRFGFIALGFGLLSLLILLRIVTYERITNLPWDVNVSTENNARGSVVDRYGELLAFDRFYSEVSATPSHLNDDERRDVAARLEMLLGIDASQTLQILTESADREYTLIAKDLPLDTGHRLLDYQNEAGDLDPISELRVSFAPKRFYPQREVACHVVGIVGFGSEGNDQRRGFYGTEGYYDSYLLKNSPGISRRSVDIADILTAAEQRYLPSPVGRDLMLTIDRSIQWIAEDELLRSLAKVQSRERLHCGHGTTDG